MVVFFLESHGRFWRSLVQWFWWFLLGCSCGLWWFLDVFGRNLMLHEVVEVLNM